MAEALSSGAGVAGRVAETTRATVATLAGGRRPLLDRLAEASALDRVAEPLQDVVRRAVRPLGPAVRSFLHGTWLGHPLHAVLTDVPVGAWTVAAVLDLTDGRDHRAADAAIAVGLVGAAGAAVTGLVDWHVVGGRRRRVGVVHGLLNVAAGTLYGASLAMRRRGARAAGRRLAWLGYATVAASAYLGGSLVYEERMGTDHAAEVEPPEGFTAVLREDELPEGIARRVVVQGAPVLLVRQEGRLHALVERCAHLGGPLAEGTIGPGTVRCPWHGSLYALDDGRVLEGPSVHPQPCLEVRVVDGRIEVRRRAAA